MLDEGTKAILALYARGLSTAEVADDLGTDVGTVRAYLAEAMARLGARSKLEAIVLAVRRGLIEVREPA